MACVLGASVASIGSPSTAGAANQESPGHPSLKSAPKSTRVNPPAGISNATPIDARTLSGRPAAAAAYFYAVRDPHPSPGVHSAPIPRSTTLRAAKQAPVAAGGAAWTSIGPASATGGQIPGGGNVSGRVYGVTPDPGDTTGNTIYIAAASGGVWKTTNKGGSWTPLTDSQDSLATRAIVLDPTNTQNVYASTGDKTASNSAYGTDGSYCSPAGHSGYFGAGILASGDGGGHWATIGADKFTGQAIVDMDISPDGKSLYVAATNGFWVGTKGLTGNWTFTDPGIGCYWSSVRVNPANPDIVNIGGFGGPWTYRVATNSLTPSRLCASSSDCTSAPPFTTATIGRTTIAVDPPMPNYVYASMQCLANTGACPTDGGNPAQTYAWWGVFESSDYGSTFHPLFIPGPGWGGAYEYSQTDYDLTLAVDPIDDNYLYFGLVDLGLFSYLTNTVSFVSAPGVGGFLPCNQWYTGRFTLSPGIHCDQQGIGFDRSGTLYVGTDGGVFSSPPASRGGQWINRNSNLAISQFYPGVGYNTNNPNRLLGGTQDNGTPTWNGTSWQQTLAGDGGFTAIDPANPTDTWYGSYPGLCVNKTQNGSTPWSASSGPTWSPKTNGFHAPPAGSLDCVRGALFIAPFAMDPSNHLKLLAGADTPYLSIDGGDHWRDIGGAAVFPVSGKDAISATTICSDPTNAGRFLVGSAFGHVFRTTNGYSSSPTWTELSAGLSTQWITRLVCLADGTTYASVGGGQTGTPHVFKLAPGGLTWISVQGDLPNTTVTSVLVDGSTLYASTDIGVFTSANGGINWTRFGTGLPNVPVVDLVLDAGRSVMYAATHGRGAWKIDVTGSATSPVQVLPAMANAAYGGYTTAAYIKNTGSAPAQVSIRYFDTNGAVVGRGDLNTALPVNAVWTVRQDNGDAFAAGGAGSALIVSDQPVAAFVNEFAPTNTGDATSYTAISLAGGTGATLYTPAIANNAYGGYTTGIGLINMGNTSTDVTITYRDPNGSVTSAQSLTAVPAHAYRGVYSGDAGQPTDARLPNNFAGTATITSSTGGSLAAIVNEVGPGGQFSSYDAVPQGNTALAAPAALNNAFGGFNTGMGVQNTTSGAGTVTVTYYDANGQATTKQAPIPANGYLGIYQGGGTLAPSPGAYTARLTSTVALAAIVNEVAPAPANGPQQSTSYNTFATGSGSVHLPLVESAGSDGWSTGLGIMNAGTTATAVTVSYFDASTGQPVGTPASNASLAPNAFWGVYQPNSGLPAGTRATAVVSTAAGGSVVVICNESADTTFMSYDGQ